MKNWSIEIINDFSSFCKISEEWDNLHQSNRNLSIYQSHSWIKSWLEVFIDEINLYIVIIRNSDSKIIFIAPLMLQKRRFLKFFNIDTIQFIGNNRSDYCDFIYEQMDIKVLDNLISFLKNNNPDTILFFENINELSNSYNILNNIKRNKIVFEYIESHYLDLKNLNDIKYKKKNTENLKRRLDKKGSLKFMTLDNLNKINKYISTFFEQHVDKWGVKSLFNNEKNRIFYKKLAKNLAHKKVLDFKIIKQNGTVLATHFGFIENKTFYYYKPTYNLSFGKFSPGNILLQNLIESSINNGHDIFDFGTGGEIYKKRFSNNTSFNFSFIFISKNYFISFIVSMHHNFNKLSSQLRKIR